MSDFLASLIRTYVPVAVGAALAWLVTLGVELDPTTEAGLVTGLTGVLIGAYYTIVRALEARWPFLGIFLGSTGSPTYTAKTGDHAA